MWSIGHTRFIFQFKFVVFVLFGFFRGIQRYVALRPQPPHLHQKAKIDGTAKTSFSKRLKAGHPEKMIGVDTCWSKFLLIAHHFSLYLCLRKMFQNMFEKRISNLIRTRSDRRQHVTTIMSYKTMLAVKTTYLSWNFNLIQDL